MGEEEVAQGGTGRQQLVAVGAQQQGQQGGQQQQQQQLHRLQTFVFSATITLPANLRKRLRKGGGGASGSSDLDGLMDNIPFR